MASKYATGKRAWGICGRSGRRMLLRDMVFDGRYPNMRVDPAWWEPKDPLETIPKVEDPIALWRPSPEDPAIPPVLAGEVQGGSNFLSWTEGDPHGGARFEQYVLYRAESTDNGVTFSDFSVVFTGDVEYDDYMAVVSIPLEYLDEDVVSDVTYRYYVHARNANGNGPASNRVDLTPTGVLVVWDLSGDYTPPENPAQYGVAAGFAMRVKANDPDVPIADSGWSQSFNIAGSSPRTLNYDPDILIDPFDERSLDNESDNPFVLIVIPGGPTDSAPSSITFGGLPMQFRQFVYEVDFFLESLIVATVPLRAGGRVGHNFVVTWPEANLYTLRANVLSMWFVSPDSDDFGTGINANTALVDEEWKIGIPVSYGEGDISVSAVYNPFPNSFGGYPQDYNISGTFIADNPYGVAYLPVSGHVSPPAPQMDPVVLYPGSLTALGTNAITFNDPLTIPYSAFPLGEDLTNAVVLVVLGAYAPNSVPENGPNSVQFAGIEADQLLTYFFPVTGDETNNEVTIVALFALQSVDTTSLSDSDVVIDWPDMDGQTFNAFFATFTNVDPSSNALNLNSGGWDFADVDGYSPLDTAFDLPAGSVVFGAAHGVTGSNLELFGDAARQATDPTDFTSVHHDLANGVEGVAGYKLYTVETNGETIWAKADGEVSGWGFPLFPAE